MTDPDDHLTPHERTRRSMHRAVDNIARAWPLAVEDANARGYPSAVMQPHTGGSESTSVESAALRPSRAVAWLAELYDVQNLLFTNTAGHSYVLYTPSVFQQHAHAYVERMLRQWMPQTEQTIRRTITLANKAQLWWPPTPVKGATIQGVSVGQRGNDVQICAYCDEPVAGGAQDPLRRIDDDVFHKSPCWYAASVSRGRHTSKEVA